MARKTARDAEATPERMAKLPVWARNHIADLVRERDEATRQYLEQFDSQTPTRVTYGDHYNNPRYLRDDGHDSVRFNIDEHRWVELAPVRNKDRHYGEPDVKITASTGMVILPQVSNVIGVRVMDR